MISARLLVLEIVWVVLEMAAQATDGGSFNAVGSIDCQDVKRLGAASSKTGVYMIFPRDTDGFGVRCDMTTSGGGWTVIQRRISDTDFYKNWVEYQKGFGDLATNFYLGNEKIHSITSQGVYQLRVEMIGPADEVRYAQYKVFAIGDAGSKYKLLIGEYSGDAGDGLTYHNDMKFSTRDQDNDDSEKNCAMSFTGAWWYNDCHKSNPNGIYGNKEFGKGITWEPFTTYDKSLKSVEMKIRRLYTPENRRLINTYPSQYFSVCMLIFLCVFFSKFDQFL